MSGGATHNLFPKVQKWLLDSITNRLALEFVLPVKTMKAYQSVMDFLLCEIFPDYKPKCLDFYQKKGPALELIITKQEAILIEAKLIKALAFTMILYEANEQNLKTGLNWPTFVQALRKE